MKRLKQRRPRLIAMLAMTMSAVVVFAQSYPSKPVRIMVPFPAGGPVDSLARVISPKLAEAFGQPVLVDNRPGAGGNLAADLVAKSAPDGHTILMTPNGLAISPVLYRKLPFDPARDFAAVTQIVNSRQILVVNAGVAASSVREFVALARAKPGVLNYGSAGIGNALHMSMEMLKSAAGIDILAIPYKGEPAIVLALLAREVDAAILPMSSKPMPLQPPMPSVWASTA